jgi:hypothetical protein
VVAVDVVVFVVGLAFVVLTVGSAIRTMVVPRAVPTTVARLVFLLVRYVFVAISGREPDYERRDRVMAYYAPVSLLVLPVVWLTIVLAGYSGMYWGLGVHSVRQAYSLSGSSLLTLGFAHSDSIPRQTLMFTEAGAGVGLLALLITYLPTLYGTFSRREATVALLESRAGGKNSRFGWGPSGVEMLWRYHVIGWRGGLGEMWDRWEVWFVDVEESHTSLPVIAYFRSPQPDRSWVTAAGAVLDAAALSVAVLEGPPQPEAELCIRAGYLALRRVADVFDIHYNPEPQKGDPISITRDEFDTALAYLEEANVPLKADRDQAWLDFAGWRVNYDHVLVALAGLIMAPPALWSGDRATPYRRPRLVRPARSMRDRAARRPK